MKFLRKGTSTYLVAIILVTSSAITITRAASYEKNYDTNAFIPTHYITGCSSTTSSADLATSTKISSLQSAVKTGSTTTGTTDSSTGLSEVTAQTPVTATASVVSVADLVESLSGVRQVMPVSKS